MCKNCEHVIGTMGTSTQRNFLLRRWWVRTREVKPFVYSNGTVGAAVEFYVPIWAIPLEVFYNTIFGKVILEEVHCSCNKK